MKKRKLRKLLALTCGERDSLQELVDATTQCLENSEAREERRNAEVSELQIEIQRLRGGKDWEREAYRLKASLDLWIDARTKWIEERVRLRAELQEAQAKLASGSGAEG